MKLINHHTICSYHPFYFRGYRNKYTDINACKIMDFKNPYSVYHKKSVDYFCSAVLDILKRIGFMSGIFLIVPGHSPGSYASGFYSIFKAVRSSFYIFNKQNLLVREKQVKRLSNGGERGIDVHLKSINIYGKELIKNNRVIIIDDVLTTGSTMSACVSIVSRCCPKSIDTIVLGKTIKYLR